MTAMFCIYENHVNKFLQSTVFCRSISLAENTIELLGYGESDARIFDLVISNKKDCIASNIEKIAYAYNNRKAIFSIMQDTIKDSDTTFYQALTEQVNLSDNCITFSQSDIIDLATKGLHTSLSPALFNVFWLEVANVAIKFVAEDYDHFSIDDVMNDILG